MVLLSRPVSSGGSQDAYEALEIAFGGSNFEEREAVDVVSQALGVSENQAGALINSLRAGGAIQ